MTESSKPRAVWITRHPDSVDPDKLTHIALFEYHSDKDPVKFVEAFAYDEALAKIAELEKEVQHIRRLEEVCAIYEKALTWTAVNSFGDGKLVASESLESARAKLYSEESEK